MPNVSAPQVSPVSERPADLVTVPTSTRKSEWTWVFLLVWSFLLLCNSGTDESEGSQHYALAEQLVKNHSLGFTQKQEWNGFLPGPDGKYYCAHEIGNTLFALPTAVITVTAEKLLSQRFKPPLLKRFKGFIMSFQSGLYVAITLTLFFSILRSGFSLPFKDSLVATLALMLTTPLLGYTRILYDGVLAGSLLAASFLLLLMYRRQFDCKYLLCTFALLGFATITRLPMVLAIGATVVYVAVLPKLSIPTKSRHLIVSLLTLTPFLVFQLWYNALRTGSCTTPPIIGLNPFNDNIFLGMYGMLLSPGKGLLVYAPLLILSLFAVPKFSRRFAPELIYIATIGLAWLLVHSRLQRWDGCWCWGPRYFITVLPILFIPVALTLRSYLADKNIFLKVTTFSLLAWGLILNLSSIVVDFGFRITYLEACHIDIQQLIWSPIHNQAFDAISAAAGNILRVFDHSPIITFKGTSIPESAWPMATQYASSTINIWPNTLHYIGTPLPLVLLAVAPILALMIISARNVSRLAKQSI